MSVRIREHIDVIPQVCDLMMLPRITPLVGGDYVLLILRAEQLRNGERRGSYFHLKTDNADK
jgi:hypothetical protein